MWAEAVAREEDPRCASCWLRQRQCYCAVFRNRRAALATRFNTARSEASAEELESGVRLRYCEVLLYYHHDELGRSCNTGRVLETLSPLSCRSLLHGDQDKVWVIALATRLLLCCAELTTCAPYAVGAPPAGRAARRAGRGPAAHLHPVPAPRCAHPH